MKGKSSTGRPSHFKTATHLATVTSLLAVSACTPMAERARSSFVGMALPDMLACAGNPAHIRPIGPDEWILAYGPRTTDSPSLTGSVPILGDIASPTVSIENSSSCAMTVRIHGAYVKSVHFVAGSSMLMGPNIACAPLVRDCLHHPDHTTLPDDYDPKSVLGKP